MPARAVYRQDVEGLRAVAVGGVLLFHAAVPGFGGGFVGVDVFFVISGFLITRIIARDLDGGTFSLAGFYERRARRILPALVVMTVATLAVGTYLLMPTPLERLARSAASAMVFVSNLYFADVLGYFGPNAGTVPLLHTWSLAVEEQFYLVFPLLLMALWHSSRQPIVTGALLVLAAASFAAALWAVSEAPRSAFFLAPMRAWEFLAGALLSLVRLPAPRGRLADLEGLAGLALVVLPMIFYRPSTPFPGLTAVPPVLGTVLVIRSGGAGRGLAVRFLTLRAVRFIGRISYSLYLWHWPILALSRVRAAGAPLSWGAIAAALLGTILISALSWRFIEEPARRMRLPRLRVFGAAGIASMAIVGTAGAIDISDGMPGRLDPAVVRLAAGSRDFDRRRYACFLGHLPEPARCPVGNRGNPRLLLWGDSHAAALVPAVESIGVSGVFAGRDACPPFLGVDTFGTSKCSRFNDRVRAWLDTGAGRSIDTVLLAARWSLYEAGRLVPRTGSPATFSDSLGDDRQAVFRRGLDRTLAALRSRGKRVVLVGGVPEIGFDVPVALAERAHLGLTRSPAPTGADIERRQEGAMLPLRGAARRDGVEFIRLDDLFCPGPHRRCLLALQGHPLYSDDDHISIFAARYVVGPALKNRLKNDWLSELRTTPASSSPMRGVAADKVGTPETLVRPARAVPGRPGRAGVHVKLQSGR